MLDLFTVENAVALLTLTSLEVVLGIDNLVFIAILAGKLPAHQRLRASRTGIAAAVLTRVALLLTLSTLMQLTKPLFTIAEQGFSGKDLVLIAGGLFLIYKSVTEIHGKIEGGHMPGAPELSKAARFAGVVVQIMLIDIVFSIDSVVTAIGMSSKVPIMVTAVLLSAGVMVAFAGPVMNFVQKHPTIKMLALSFLLLIGFAIVAEGCHHGIPKGYIYFAMGFSLAVELLNLRMRRKISAAADKPAA